MTVKHNQPITTGAARCSTVHLSRSLTRTVATVAVLALALVLIIVLR